MNENEIVKTEPEKPEDDTEIAIKAPESTNEIDELSARAAMPAAPAAGIPQEEASQEAEEPAKPDLPAEPENPDCGTGASAEQMRGGAGAELPDISDSDMRRIMSDPMFPSFARGRSGDITSLCRNFCTMLESGENARSRTNLDPSVIMRVTPRTDGTVISGVALTERQRMLAREAGMSYREYHDMILGIPEQTHNKN